MMKRLALIILLLFGLYSPALGAFAVDGVDNPAAVDGVSNPASVDGVVGCTPASQNANVTIYWQGECQDCVAAEAAGTDFFTGSCDNTWDANGNPTAAALNTNMVKHGTNGLDLHDGNAGTGQYMNFDIDTNVDTCYDGADFRVAFPYYHDTSYTDAGTTIFHVMDVPSGYIVYISQESGNTLRLRHYDGNAELCDTTVALTTGWYWVEARIDMTASELEMWVYGFAGATPDVAEYDSCENLTATMSDLGDPTVLKMGNHYGTRYGDFYLDGPFIFSTDEDTSLKDYANDSGYDTCN